jgi:hypothetical protein
MGVWPFSGASTGDRSWEDYPYERLFDHFSSDPARAMEEFDHRLWRTVFSMALERAQDEGLLEESRLKDRAATLTDDAFAAFESKFDKGQSEYGLARFGETLQSVLGEDVFRRNAVRFYTQLPLYYLTNREQRQCLALVLERGLSAESFEEVARLKDVTVDSLKAIVFSALKALEEVKRAEFDTGELAQWTEGYLR